MPNAVYKCSKKNPLQIKSITLPALGAMSLESLENPWVIINIPENKISVLKEKFLNNPNIFPDDIRINRIRKNEYKIIGKPLRAIVEIILENAPLADKTEQETLKVQLKRIERYANFRNIKLETVIKNGKEIPQLTFSISQTFLDFLDEEKVYIFKDVNRTTADDSDYGNGIKTNSVFVKHTITGKQSVLAALKCIFKYQQNWEKSDREKLRQEMQRLEKARQEKIAKAPTTPTLTVKYSDLTVGDNVKLTSYRTVKEVTVSEKPFIFKVQNVDRKGAQYQVAIALRNKILLGVQSPLTYTVINENGERVGIISEKIPNLVTINEDYFKNTKDWTIKNGIVARLANAKLGAVLAVMHVHFEDDCHPGNIGFSNGLVVNFDDDRKLRQITSKYQGSDPKLERRRPDGKVFPAPENAFPIDRHDIIKNPQFTKARPTAQISDFFNAVDKNISSDLAKDPNYKRDKYKHYLKHILLDKKLEEKIAAAANFSKPDNHFTELMKHSKTEFEKELFEIPEFLDLLINDEELEKEIINEFTAYNEYANDIPAIKDVQVDLDALKEKYADLKKSALQKKAELPVVPSDVTFAEPAAPEERDTSDQPSIPPAPIIIPKIDAQQKSSTKSELRKITGIGSFTIAGAFFGGLLGSFFPVVGTIIGACIGGAVGGLIGVTIIDLIENNEEEETTVNKVETVHEHVKDNNESKKSIKNTKQMLNSLGKTDGKREITSVENTDPITVNNIRVENTSLSQAKNYDHGEQSTSNPSLSN